MNTDKPSTGFIPKHTQYTTKTQSYPDVIVRDAEVAVLGELLTQFLLQVVDCSLGLAIHLEADNMRVAGYLQPLGQVIYVGLDVLQLTLTGDLVSHKFGELGDVVSGGNRGVNGDEVVVQHISEDAIWRQTGLESVQRGHYLYENCMYL